MRTPKVVVVMPAYNAARTLDLQVVVHRQNLGYGGNQKTCYATVLAEGAGQSAAQGGDRPGRRATRSPGQLTTTIAKGVVGA